MEIHPACEAALRGQKGNGHSGTLFELISGNTSEMQQKIIKWTPVERF